MWHFFDYGVNFLESKYKNAVFVSAAKKINVEEIINKINEMIE